MGLEFITPQLHMAFTRYPWWRRWFGQRSERYVARYLRRKGYRILGRNIADLRGEIDLLALDGQTIVIVEVRSSESKAHQDLAGSVHATKQKKLTEATLRFLKRRHLWNIPIRFDVITLRWPTEQTEPELQHIRHAFQAVGQYQLHS